jgi:hypothetical protein
MKEILRRKIKHFIRHIPPASVLDDSAGRIFRELWWMNQKFCPVGIIAPWLGDEK